jgi:hypothetical protein
MMGVNQMMMLNMNNQFNFINQNQKNLVDKIIQFYQKTGGLFMNYNEKNQIKNLLDNLDINSPKLKEGNDIVNPLPYIKEKKKLIKFINHDFKIFNVKVPISIDKMTLYQIADMYKSWYFSKFLLVYMNCILNEDESSIESISDGDFVIIIENKYYLDDTYLNSLTNENNSGKKINVTLQFTNGFKRNLIIPVNTKSSQLYKALILKFGCECNFLYLGEEMHFNDDRNIFNGNVIECIDKGGIIAGNINIIGKKIELEITLEDQGDKKPLSQYAVGVLSSVKKFLKAIENLSGLKVKGFYLDKREIYIKEDRSFSSLGIIANCKITLIIDRK